MSGSARVSDSAWVSDRDHLITVTGMGASGTVTLMRTDTGHLVHAGCWAGTLDEMRDNLRDPAKHWPDASPELRDRWVAEYRLARKLFKVRVAAWESAR